MTNPAAPLHALLPAPANPPVRGSIIAGAAVIAGFFGAFGLFGVLAPITSAALAPGIVKVDSHRKTIQHQDGGTITELLVRDGDQVRKGQIMVRMNDLDAKADTEALNGEINALRAKVARLVAQRDDNTEIAFPIELLVLRGDASIEEILAGQERIWRDNAASIAAQTSIWSQRIQQYRSQLPLVGAQIKAIGEKRRLLTEQVADTKKLLAKGLALKTTAFELERQIAIVDGELASAASSQTGLKSQIAEAEFQINAIRQSASEQVSADLRDAQTRLASLEKEFSKAAARADRHEVVAPQDGIVMNSRYFTAGAVVPAGGAMLDLVPKEDRLTIEARIEPTDIDIVRADLEANIRLVAFDQRTTPVITGRVTQVSADALTEEKTGHTYFTALINISGQGDNELPQLLPGMPVEVSIVTGSRTLLDYLIQPIANSFARAMRES